MKAAGVMFLHGTARGGRVLLLRYSAPDGDGLWTIPGGHCEEGEDFEACAKREAIEETGFPLAESPAFGTLELHARRNADGVDFATFLCKVAEQFTPVLSDEHDSFCWQSVFEDGSPRADDFVETEHPRGGGGKFQSKGGVEAAPGGGSTAGAGEKAGARARKNRPETALKREGKTWLTSSGGEPPAHIAALKIPPAWADVRVNEDPDADLLVTGKDAKGRPTAIYSQKFVDHQAATKFSRIAELDEKFDAIMEQNATNRAGATDAATLDNADVLNLIMAMGVRPGSDDDTGAKVKAYGATTLEGRHVVQGEDGSVRLKFTGKKGVALDLPVTDEALAASLAERAEKAGGDGKLFPSTDAKKLLDYVHSLDGGGFKTKDFRTRLGTSTAQALVAEREPPKNEAEYKKAVMEIAKEVSGRLGNTPVIALQSYISPTVFLQWRSSL